MFLVLRAARNYRPQGNSSLRFFDSFLIPARRASRQMTAGFHRADQGIQKSNLIQKFKSQIFFAWDDGSFAKRLCNACSGTLTHQIRFKLSNLIFHPSCLVSNCLFSWVLSCNLLFSHQSCRPNDFLSQICFAWIKNSFTTQTVFNAQGLVVGLVENERGKYFSSSMIKIF